VPASSQKTAEAPGPPYRVGGEVTRPEIVSQTRPVYTELARKSRVTGTVIVEAIIDEQGDVTNARVLKGLPMGLDQAALDAITTWKFKPATLEGHPVKVYYVLTVNFQVDDSPFDDGPIFRKLLADNPEFAAALKSRHFQEAEALLNRWGAERPADPAIPLARVRLLLERRQYQEAWQIAQDDHGLGRYESLCSVGAFAWRQALGSANSRAEAIELGLEAETAAMATQPAGIEAIRSKISLLRLKADLPLDPAQRQAVIEEADLLQKQVAELQRAPSAIK
jgi:TonB family protein